jgi:hypothetical protein
VSREGNETRALSGQKWSHGDVFNLCEVKKKDFERIWLSEEITVIILVVTV